MRHMESPGFEQFLQEWLCHCDEGDPVGPIFSLCEPIRVSRQIVDEHLSAASLQNKSEFCVEKEGGIHAFG